MQIVQQATVHGTVHFIGTAPREEAATLRRSISSQAGKQKFGKRLRIVQQRQGGLVTIQAAYRASK